MTILMLTSCSEDKGKLQEAGETGPDEISGLAYVDGALWGIEDSGNESKLYKLGNTGAIEAEIALTNVKNNDWEDLATDHDGNIYIGDFGNNDNERKDLAIYKIDKGSLAGPTAEATSVIYFYYPEQKEFPPKRSQKFYDVEAFFEHKGSFYLYTKNRSARFDGTVHIYKVPNRAGRHKAKLMGNLKTCSYYRKCVITGADISPDGKKALLLSSDKIWVISGFNGDDFTSGEMQSLPLGHYSQKEAITFKNNDVLLIADEEEDNIGGKLYEVNLNDL